MKAEDLRLPHSDAHGPIIFAAVREGLSPFKAETIHIYMEYDADFHHYRLVIEAHFKSRWYMGYVEKVDAFKLAGDPNGEVEKLYPKILQAFRDREDYALAPLIHLGEN